MLSLLKHSESFFSNLLRSIKLWLTNPYGNPRQWYPRKKF